MQHEISPQVEQLRLALEHLLILIVEHKSNVTVLVEQGEQTSHFRVWVHKNDLGMVIGRQGAMANAIRTILQSLGGKSKIRTAMTVEE